MTATTDLDAVYKVMRAKSDPVEVSGEAERYRNEVADAFAKYFAAILWDQAQRVGCGADGYEDLYDERAPKAMMLITISIGIVRDLASGGADASLDAFLEGVARVKA
jgi:hypothetical protein